MATTATVAHVHRAKRTGTLALRRLGPKRFAHAAPKLGTMLASDRYDERVHTQDRDGSQNRKPAR